MSAFFLAAPSKELNIKGGEADPAKGPEKMGMEALKSAPRLGNSDLKALLVLPVRASTHYAPSDWVRGGPALFPHLEMENTTSAFIFASGLLTRSVV